MHIDFKVAREPLRGLSPLSFALSPVMTRQAMTGRLLQIDQPLERLR
jgi:hypothetical protein